MKRIKQSSSRFLKEVKHILLASFLIFITVSMNSCDKDTVEDVLTELGKMTTYSVAYAENSGSGYNIKFAEIEDAQLKNTKTIVSSTDSKIFDLSDDGKLLAHVTDNSVDIYNTSTGNKIESYSAELWSNNSNSDVADMLRDAVGPGNALVDILDVDWSSQNSDYLGIHCQITDNINHELVGAKGIIVKISSDKGKDEIKTLAGATSQNGFHSFDWSPNDASVTYNTNTSSEDVYYGSISSSSSGNFGGENPEWGNTGIAYIDNGQVDVYTNGSIANITSLSGLVSEVDMSAAGNNNKNDMISWLYNGKIYFAVSDGNAILPANPPYTDSNNGFEVPINASIVAFDVATNRYAP